MITAIIRNKENTLVLELPHSIYDIYEKLQSIGIMQPPKRIPLTDNEDEDIGVIVLGAELKRTRCTLPLTLCRPTGFSGGPICKPGAKTGRTPQRTISGCGVRV